MAQAKYLHYHTAASWPRVSGHQPRSTHSRSQPNFHSLGTDWENYRKKTQVLCFPPSSSSLAPPVGISTSQRYQHTLPFVLYSFQFLVFLLAVDGHSAGTHLGLSIWTPLMLLPKQRLYQGAAWTVCSWLEGKVSAALWEEEEREYSFLKPESTTLGGRMLLMKSPNQGFQSLSHHSSGHCACFFPSDFFYPFSLHPSFKQLVFFSAPPAALLLQPNEWDRASKHSAALKSHTEWVAWLMAWRDRSSCFISLHLERLSSGQGLLPLSSAKLFHSNGTTCKY